MTFDPGFAFYRDARPVAGPADAAFWDDLRVELRRTFDERHAAFPALVQKGRMSRADADRELRVSRQLAEDGGGLPRTDGFPHAGWAEIVHGLRRDIAIRRRLYPDHVAAGRLAADEAEHRLLTIERCHDVLWHTARPDAAAARAAVAAAAPAQAALPLSDAA